MNAKCLPCFASKKSLPIEPLTKISFEHEYYMPKTYKTDGCTSSSSALPLTHDDSRITLCRQCFSVLYGFTVYEIEQACNRLKENYNAKEVFKKSFKDDTNHPYNWSEAQIIFSHNLVHEQATSGSRPFDDSMISDSLLPQSDIDLSLWLEDTFLTYGDSAPNRNAVFLAATFKRDIWQLYTNEMKAIGQTPVNEKKFSEIWLAVYPSYLVRPYANVVGKCDTCYTIDYQRRAASDDETKQALRQAHLMHRLALLILL